MNKLTTTLAALLLTAAAAFCQPANVRTDNSGNFHAIKATRADTAKATGQTYTDKSGAVWPVFRSPSGKLFALRISRNGRQYKYYIKPDGNPE